MKGPSEISTSPGQNLLVDPVFTVVLARDVTSLSLAGLIGKLLSGGDVSAFPHLMPEQRGHLWRFLVRCAAKALHELGAEGNETFSRSEETLVADIADALSNLAADGGWLLHQSDPSRPAFLQVATPDGEFPGKANGYRERQISLLTSTIGGKNHERKSGTVRELSPEQAVYALIEYQFAAVYGGRGNYESQLVGSRSGAGSGVPFMGARIANSNSLTFRHDVRVMLDRWTTIKHKLNVRGSVWALWCEPWDGVTPIGSEHLDPAFIPLARMVRLAPTVHGVFRTVWFKPSDGGRVRDHTAGGNLGDPFTPLVPNPKTGTPKVRGTLRDGYGYTEVVRLLGGDATRGGTPSPSVQALADLDDGHRTDLHVIFEGIAFEQGKTGGFHSRTMLLPWSARNFLMPAAASQLRAAHAELLDRVRDAKSALRGAARILLAGSPRPRQGDEGKSDVPIDLFDEAVDQVYLQHLFTAAQRSDQGDPEWVQHWVKWLCETMLEVHRKTAAMLPVSTGRRWQREIEAERYLHARMWALRGGDRPTADGDAEGGFADATLADDNIIEEVS